jgi:YD repeat-containing protein
MMGTVLDATISALVNAVSRLTGRVTADEAAATALAVRVSNTEAGKANKTVPVTPNSIALLDAGGDLEDSGLTLVPVGGTITRDGDGVITEIALDGGETYAFAYNGDGSLNTIENSTYQWAMDYDGDGNLSGWEVAAA